MTAYHFTWDPAKAAANFRKHGIAFEDAIDVFLDPLRLTVQDRIEGQEHRWQTVGTINWTALVVVAHTDNEDDGTVYVRIISARRASKHERRNYEHENRHLHL